MVLTHTLQESLEKLLENCDLENLKTASDTLTHHYKTIGSLQNKEERIAYLVVRFPATYEVVSAILRKIPFPIESFLDLGSGPGTASFAAQELWSDKIKTTCVEKDPFFCNVARKLGFKSDIIEKDLKEMDTLEPHDAVCFGYSFGEVLDESVLQKSWLATKKVLILVEPGTPKGYQNILMARKLILQWQGHILAPCPHEKKCPLEGSDWCHFSERVERTFLHRVAKKATLPYEDEKYSYAIFAKEPFSQSEARILRVPLKKTGHVRLFLCCPDGEARHHIISRKDKDLYRKTRKADWGDTI